MTDSPVVVQHWVDTLPPAHCNQARISTTGMAASPVRNPRLCLLKDYSQQSQQSDDASSYCSSVESVLEQRKPDPEEVLIGLGFGPPQSSSVISRIPQRFLQPSKLIPQIDINKFLEKHGIVRDSDQSSPTSPARFRPKPN